MLLVYVVVQIEVILTFDLSVVGPSPHGEPVVDRIMGVMGSIRGRFR